MTAETRVERRIVVGHRMIGVFEDDGTEQRLIANFWQPQTTVAEARENARLFLAAPDLLTELQRLSESFGWEPDHPANVAIRKARGES